MWEDVYGPDTPLGHVEVPISSFKAQSEPQAGWHELVHTSSKKPAGQVFLVIHLIPMSGQRENTIPGGLGQGAADSAQVLEQVHEGEEADGSPGDDGEGGGG